MTQEPIEKTELPQSHNNISSPHLTQYGFLSHDSSGFQRDHSAASAALCRPRAGRREPLDGVDANQLDEQLRRLSVDGPAVPGQRISEYEKAARPQTSRHDRGFQVAKRATTQSNGVLLNDFPNEILTHIFSHLPPDCHASIALVSKRFWALVTTHHAWRMAFMRYFPGQTVLEAKERNIGVKPWDEPASDIMRYETRFFPRLTSLATWRSEYLFRTRHLRSLARGKPGTPTVGSSRRVGRSGKKSSAVLTYNSKLPWQVTNIHAVFANGKKPPRVIQGTGDLGVAAFSDPTSGKVEKWGLEDLFTAAQLHEVAPNLLPYGVGDGPAGVPNVMDVSQSFGMLSGEGFPGGRPYFRGANEPRGRYLGDEAGVIQSYPDIPKIPEMLDAICSVWIAKSSAVVSATLSMCGMLTGSALGVVTAYALGWDTTGPRYANGDVTARWIVSPGVPIISLRVDDSYSQKRKLSSRMWAVALNALGEIYYLTKPPVGRPARATGEDVTKNAWLAGRTVYWHLLESTRRVAREVEEDKNAVRGAYSPRSPSNSMNLSKEQMAAEAREIETFMRHRPAHFRKVCDGWDMRRRLEVDFANDDGSGAGENVFLIDCGFAENQPARIRRFSRSLISAKNVNEAVQQMTTTLAPVMTPSLFGNVGSLSINTPQISESQSPLSPPPTPSSPPTDAAMTLHDWSCRIFDMDASAHYKISAVALDSSLTSNFTLTEDPLQTANTASSNSSPWADQGAREIPGQRSRYIVVGTNNGSVLVWNARDEDKTPEIQPLRIIQTESPEISAVATSGLYLVHGGSDGLVQAWDPLASITEPIRTINSKSNGRVPRHMLAMNLALSGAAYSAVRAISLDPDPTVLQGVVSFGTFIRYWSYSSTSHTPGRKRRVRHSDVDGRLASRRQGDAVAGFIAAEEAELWRDNEQRAREQSRLLRRFGALGDLTEEEAIRYAQMVSEEAFRIEEQHRASDSAADASLDTASSVSENTAETPTPDPSVTGHSAPEMNGIVEEESEYEQQIQAAIRLSLMEGVNESGQSPQGNSSGDFDFPISVKFKSKSGRRGKQLESGSPSAGHSLAGGPSKPTTTEDEELALALSLSMQDQELISPTSSLPDGVGLGVLQEEFPSLPGDGAGKGKGVQRW